MNDDPTEEEIKRILEGLECCMVAIKPNAPEFFTFVWRWNLYAFANMMDGRGKSVYVLKDTATENMTWCQV